MAPCPVKKYEITGPTWTNRRLQIQQDGITILWANSNNKYGPWKDPFVTLHTDRRNGEIVAAAKLRSINALKNRDFKVWLGNPDCTDLGIWPVVACKGRWMHEYRFEVGGEGFAWRRTRDRGLGVKSCWRRDFKLVKLGTASTLLLAHGAEEDDEYDEHSLNDGKEAVDQTYELPEQDSERILGIYIFESDRGKHGLKARLHLFEDLGSELELWCLVVVMGVQEKIRKSQEAWALRSISYGGGLWALGNYV